MSTNADPEHLARLSRVYGPETWDVYEILDQSLQPRGPDWLHEKAAQYLRPSDTILDAGCRDAEHLIRLVRANDVQAVGVEPVAIHVERARAAVAAAGLQDRITIVQGTMDDFGYPESSFDFVWCRDVLEQVEPLQPALDGLARAVKPGGALLVFTVFKTALLEPPEAAMLLHSMGNVDANLDERFVEAAFLAAGLKLEEKHSIGTEWREYAEERNQPVSRALLRLARLRRLREQVVRARGQDIYDHIEANLHWELFQFLGKLMPVVYVLRRG